MPAKDSLEAYQNARTVPAFTDKQFDYFMEFIIGVSNGFQAVCCLGIN